MRITGRDLKKIIKEELIREGDFDSAAYIARRDDPSSMPPEPEPEGLVQPAPRDVRAESLAQMDLEVRTAYMRMRVKPIGFVVDVSEMEGSGGGEYPVYWADGTNISKICRTMGEGAFDLLDLAAEGRMPRGIFIASTDGEGGPLRIVNRV